MMAWKSGLTFSPTTFFSVLTQPARALAKRMGKSIWCSSASRSRNNSSTWCTTSSMRASGRSTLLMTSTTGSRASSVLPSTKRVCGSGPSEASTSNRTPSTMFNPRSTSPPKSAWPGVSMTFILTPPQRTAVFLARMVMPFSRSRSPESMTRSVISWWAPNAPVWRKRASTRVVLPWSTWATMATLRMSSRVCMGVTTIGAVSGVSCRSPGSTLRGPEQGHGTGHGDHAQGEGDLVDLEADEVTRIGPPPHDSPRWPGVAGLQGLGQRHPAELGPDRGSARPTEDDQVHRDRVPPAVGTAAPNLGAAPDGQEGGVWAVPPMVPADGGRAVEGLPVEAVPQSRGPGDGIGLDGGTSGGRQAGQPLPHGGRGPPAPSLIADGSAHGEAQ